MTDQNVIITSNNTKFSVSVFSCVLLTTVYLRGTESDLVAWL